MLHGVRDTLNFRKFKIALSPHYRIFLNFAKSCILLCFLQFSKKECGSSGSFLSYKHLNLKRRVVLAVYIVGIYPSRYSC